MAFDVAEKFIAAAENSLGVRLPDSYREALKAENGGSRKLGSDVWTLIPVFDQQDRKRMSRTSNHILRETKAMSGWAGWPPTAICIASNGMGDALAFLRDGAACAATVYLWNHETGHLTPVAKDFADLKK